MVIATIRLINECHGNLMKNKLYAHERVVIIITVHQTCEREKQHASCVKLGAYSLHERQIDTQIST